MKELSSLDKALEEKFQEAITEDLKRGSGFVNGKERIRAMYEKDITKTERIKLLKDEYGIGGYIIDGLMQSHDSKGITIELETGQKKSYTWNKIHDLILELINSGEY